MVKPILLVVGAIPIILAILIMIPLVTAPEIPNTAIDPSDKSEIEFTTHHLRNVLTRYKPIELLQIKQKLL